MAPHNHAKKVTVLVVEDEALLLMNMVDVIEAAGFIVLVATNADEAIRLLEQCPDVRVVFTDIDMPGSMDGLKLAAAVRGRWPPIEIIVTSGHRRVAAEDLPARGVFYPKPYDANKIVSEINRMAA